MSARKAIGSIHFDSSAFIPLVTSSYPSHGKILAYVRNVNADLSIDTVVLSEVLAGSNLSGDRELLARKYSKQFRVFPFDTRASVVCAELFRTLKDAGQIPRPKTERQITKADLMILATAMTNGVTEFLFEDKHFSQYPNFFGKTICGYPLPVFKRLSELPDILEQQEIPGLEVQEASDRDGV